MVLDPAEELVQFDGSAVIRRDPPQVAAEHLVRVHEVGVWRTVLGDALEPGSKSRSMRQAAAVRIRQGFIIAARSYPKTRSSLIFVRWPSMQTPFSVMPVPSVHCSPRLRPTVCPSCTPEAAPQFQTVCSG